MRTSILTRSAVAVATLAIGSAALVAAPAQAATSNGITRDEVLAAAAGLRVDQPSPGGPGESGPIVLSAAAAELTPGEKALASLAAKGCGITPSPETPVFGQPAETPDGVDGLVVIALLSGEPASEYLSDAELCTFVALAPVATRSTFTGGVNVTGATLRPTADGIPSFPFGDVTVTASSEQYTLSGDVFASPARTTSGGFTVLGFDAEGLVKSPSSKQALSSVKIADKKTKADKRAAKKAYVKRLKAVKKSYAKAVKRARGNTVKKVEARMLYSARRSAAKATYAYAVADYKLVNLRGATTDERRFSVAANNNILGVFGPGGPVGPVS